MLLCGRSRVTLTVASSRLEPCSRRKKLRASLNEYYFMHLMRSSDRNWSRHWRKKVYDGQAIASRARLALHFIVKSGVVMVTKSIPTLELKGDDQQKSI